MKLIINNNVGMPLHLLFDRVKEVIHGGRISDGGESYCSATCWYDGYVILAQRNISSDTFTVKYKDVIINSLDDLKKLYPTDREGVPRFGLSYDLYGEMSYKHTWIILWIDKKTNRVCTATNENGTFAKMPTKAELDRWSRMYPCHDRTVRIDKTFVKAWHPMPSSEEKGMDLIAVFDDLDYEYHKYIPFPISRRELDEHIINAEFTIKEALCSLLSK